MSKSFLLLLFLFTIACHTHRQSCSRGFNKINSSISTNDTLTFSSQLNHKYRTKKHNLTKKRPSSSNEPLLRGNLQHVVHFQSWVAVLLGTGAVGAARRPLVPGHHQERPDESAGDREDPDDHRYHDEGNVRAGGARRLDGGLFGTVDSGESDCTVALVPVFPVAVFYADATVFANVRYGYAGIGLGALLAAHALVTAAPKRSPRVDALPAATAVDRFLDALVNVQLTVPPLEARPGTVTAVPVDEVVALATILARGRFAFVHLDLAQPARVARVAQADWDPFIISHADRIVLAPFNVAEPNVAQWPSKSSLAGARKVVTRR